jgi:Fur family ferric uptake transcriptional regulator
MADKDKSGDKRFPVETAVGEPGTNRHRHRWGRKIAAGEKPLSQCRAGDLCSIQRIINGGPIRRRLLEMGLNPGTQVRVVKYAPLKDPIECVLKGYHVALRVSEADHVIVKPEEK